MSKAGGIARLATGRNWQTLIWVSLYMLMWAYFTGMYDN